MTPRLTIGIPTHDRPDMLSRAIRSALDQTVRCKIVVCDDGSNPKTDRVCRNCAEDNPDFSYRKSPATCLWENWRFTAEQADTDFFLWLQDDDVVSPTLAERVIASFDRYPRASVYCSRLAMSYNNRLGCSFFGSWGPKLEVDYLHMQPTEFPGSLLVPVGYFDVWAQSPAKAFKVGDAFRLMLSSLPSMCDKYTERLDIAFMGLHGTAVCDPGVAGYWYQHTGMTSTLTEKEDRRQAVICYKFLDMLVEACPNWRDLVFDWLSTPG